MKGLPHTYHHYVPQCYLKRFGHKRNSGSGFYINAYLKSKNKSFSQNIDSVCGENFFYSLPDSYILQNSTEKLNALSIELDYFAENLESQYGAILNKVSSQIRLDSSKDCAIIDISDQDRLLIAKQIVIQYLRLPEVRKNDNDLSNYFDNQMMNLFKEGLSMELNNPKIADLDVTIKRDEVVNHATFSFMNELLIEKIATDMVKNIWTFYYSEEGNFYACDSPVFAYGYVKDVPNENMGLTRYGVDTSIALNPHLTLSIKDYRYFKENTKNMIIRISENLLKHYNITRYCQAKEFVFSLDGNFELINELKKIKIIYGKA